MRFTQSLHLPSLWGGFFFSSCVPLSDIINSKSVVGIKPGDSGVIGHHVMNLLTPSWWSALLLDHTFTLVLQARCQCYLTSHLKQGVRITPFWTIQSKTLSMVLILSSQDLSIHHNWMHPLMRLMPCLLQSPQGF